MMDSVEWKKSSESISNETDTVTNTKKSTKNIEEDSETEDTSTESGVSEDNTEEDYTDYKTDDRYEEDYSEDEIAYGEEEFDPNEG